MPTLMFLVLFTLSDTPRLNERYAREDTIALMVPPHRRLGAQLARLAQCQEWGTSRAVDHASRVIFACPGRLERNEDTWRDGIMYRVV